MKAPRSTGSQRTLSKPPSFACSLQEEANTRLTPTTLLRRAVKVKTQTVSGGARPREISRNRAVSLPSRQPLLLLFRL